MKTSSSRKIQPTSRPEKGEEVSNEIRFYRANEKPFGVFSNLFQRSITFEGEVFATAEHAYQAGKARKKQVRDWILSAPTPGLVAMAAHGLYTWDIVPDWSKIKFDRMRAVLRAKFSQHADLREILAHEFGLAFAHQPGIDVGRMHPIGPKRAEAQRAGDRRIHAAAHKEEHVAIAGHGANLILHGLNLTRRVPIALASADVEQEIL